MSFQDMLNDFSTILNRNDCTTSLATTFLQQGIRRIQRDCRLPNMERSLIINPTVPMNVFPAPADLIQPIDVIWTRADGRKRALVKKSYRDLVNIDPNNEPCAYARAQTQYWIAGSAKQGEVIQFFYYGNFSPFANVNAENELSASTPDLGVYAALSYAGEHFEHPNTDRWEARYQAIKTEVQAMAIDLDAEGGPQSVQPLYAWDD